ncbi:MAG: hypothetical protein FWC25_01905 [Dehalococcoidia bacterium]|nr:hypothetical protein [Dehalococcoidia bacterium]
MWKSIVKFIILRFSGTFFIRIGIGCVLLSALFIIGGLLSPDSEVGMIIGGATFLLVGIFLIWVGRVAWRYSNTHISEDIINKKLEKKAKS